MRLTRKVFKNRKTFSWCNLKIWYWDLRLVPVFISAHVNEHFERKWGLIWRQEEWVRSVFYFNSPSPIKVYGFKSTWFSQRLFLLQRIHWHRDSQSHQISWALWISRTNLRSSEINQMNWAKVSWRICLLHETRQISLFKA